MGTIVSKKKGSSCTCEEIEYMRLRDKIKLLQDDFHEIKRLREMECQTHRQQVRIFERREAQWKRERKKLRDEVRKLRKELVAKDEEIFAQGMMEKFAGINNIEKGCCQWQLMLQESNLVEHFREEQACRDEAVERWKRLYLSIKTELDTLIHRAHQGDGLYLGEEDDTMEVLKRELKIKEETIQEFKARVATMEKEAVNKEREIDILRQSLRIMSSTKNKRKG